MQVIHFTPGSLDPRNAGPRGFAASLPLANGQGDFELSAVYLAPNGQISVAPQKHGQLLLVVNGRSAATFRSGLCLDLLAGVGLLLDAGEGCQVSTTTGAVLLTIEAQHVAADPCGISSPDRVAGQQWPTLISN